MLKVYTVKAEKRNIRNMIENNEICIDNNLFVREDLCKWKLNINPDDTIINSRSNHTNESIQ